MVMLEDPRPERGELPKYRTLHPALGVAAASTRASVRTWGYVFEVLSGRRGRRFADRSLVSVSRNPMSSIHALMDELALLYFDAATDVPGVPEFIRLEGEIEELIEAETKAGVIAQPELMHPAPPAPDEARIRFQDFSGIDGEWLTFESGWEPLPDSPGQVRWSDERQNHIVRAGLLRHGGSQPRPWLVLVHGAEMGRSFDARLLRAKRLYDTLGVNVIMPVLPKHGPRRDAGETIRGSFPGIDLVENFHGLAQATWDVRRSIAWVREQDPTAVGVFGFSLGGYLSAMLAGLEPELDALIVGCPAVDLVDLFVRNMPSLQNGKSRLDKLFGRAALAYTPVAPLEMPTVLDKDRLGLIAAVADQLADPIDHVSRLWHRWDRPEIHWIASGHVSYFLRNKPIDVLEHMLIGRGVGEIDLA